MNNSHKILKLLNKINRKILLDRLYHRKNYFFDLGQTKEMIDIKKDCLNYTIVNLNTNISTDNYFVFVAIEMNGKIVTHQLSQTFSDFSSSKKYMNYLKKFIITSSNEAIIEKCYLNLPTFSQIFFSKCDIISED